MEDGKMITKERIAELIKHRRESIEKYKDLCNLPLGWAVEILDLFEESQTALSAAKAELADIRESTAWLANVDPDEMKDEELHHAALIDFRRWERLSRGPGAVGNPVYSFEDFLIPHARAQGEKKVQAELATATTEIAERDDTIDALRNDIAALRVQLSAARERIREMEAGHANFRTMADAMMRKKDSELIAMDSVVVHAKDFQTRQRGLMQTQDSYGLFQADNRLETALKRLDALRATKGAGNAT